MMFRSTDMRRLIKDFGKELTLQTKTGGSYNTSTGTYTQTVDDVFRVKGYFYDYKDSDIDGDNIQRGDRRLVISYDDTFEPDIGDEITGDGDEVSVVRVSKIMSGENPVCYILQVRD